MIRRFLAVTAVLITALGITTALILAGGWLDTRTASGTVTMSSTTPDLLYICEPSGPGTSDPQCPGDDSGADELIFEADEQLLPGQPATVWDIRLKNVRGDVQWDITSVVPTFTETADPGADCTLEPTLDMRILTDADDHGVANNSPLPALPREPLGAWYIVHVGPGGTEDIRLRVSIPGSFPMECQGNVWDLTIDWTAEIH